MREETDEPVGPENRRYTTETQEASSRGERGAGLLPTKGTPRGSGVQKTPSEPIVIISGDPVPVARPGDPAVAFVRVTVPATGDPAVAPVLPAGFIDGM
jgi:hypothetical protein